MGSEDGVSPDGLDVLVRVANDVFRHEVGWVVEGRDGVVRGSFYGSTAFVLDTRARRVDVISTNCEGLVKMYVNDLREAGIAGYDLVEAKHRCSFLIESPDRKLGGDSCGLSGVPNLVGWQYSFCDCSGDSRVCKRITLRNSTRGGND